MMQLEFSSVPIEVTFFHHHVLNDFGGSKISFIFCLHLFILLPLFKYENERIGLVLLWLFLKQFSSCKCFSKVIFCHVY
jgi:hypothetical protein